MYKTLQEVRDEWVPSTATIISDSTQSDGGVITFTHMKQLWVLRIFTLGRKFYASVDAVKDLDDLGKEEL